VIETPGDIDLIEYYAQTHRSRIYGTSSVKSLRFLRPEIAVLHPGSILDFGCGQSIFLDCLELDYDVKLHRYDPAIPAYDTLHEDKVDLLVCIDVLEHIEESELDKTLRVIRSACRDALFIMDTREASHMLPDGRNAHVSLHTHDWWYERLIAHFNHLEPVKAARRSRAGFRTWPRSPGQSVRFYGLRLRENSLHYVKRMIGRHKDHWKVSSTGQE
jgi:hypothetical protein